MNLNQICYFLEVSKQLCFSTAAQNLYMTQPALSRQISALEKELNIQLFRRSTRSIQLTPAGKYLYDQWSILIKSFDDSVIQAKKIFEGYSGKLNIGILEGIDLSLFFTDIIVKFEEKYPNIDIRMKQYSFGELRKKLALQELDGILTYSFDIQHESEKIESYNLYSYQPCWAIPISNPLAQKKELTVSDLKNEEFVLTNYEDSPAGAELMISICKELGGFVPKILYVDSLEDVILRVETSNKCTIMNQSLRVAKSNKLKTYPIVDTHDISYFAFAWNKNNQNNSLTLFKETLA